MCIPLPSQVSSSHYLKFRLTFFSFTSLMGKDMHQSSFCVWLISLNMMGLQFHLCFLEHQDFISFFFQLIFFILIPFSSLNNIFPCIYTSHFLCPFIEGFPILAAVNMVDQVPLSYANFMVFVFMPRNDMVDLLLVVFIEPPFCFSTTIVLIQPLTGRVALLFPLHSFQYLL